MLILSFRSRADPPGIHAPSIALPLWHCHDSIKGHYPHLMHDTGLASPPPPRSGSAAEAEIVALHLVIVHDRTQDAVERQVAERLLDRLQGRIVIDHRPRAFAAAAAGHQRPCEGSGERQT